MAKVNAKLVMELLSKNMSQREICRTRHIGTHTVNDIKRIAEERNITYEDIRNMSEDDVYRMFFPDRNQIENLYEQPDYEYVHGKLKRTGVTLELLWQEYQDKFASLTKIPMGCTKYCRGYNKSVVSRSLTNHLEHKPGMAVQVDWSWPTMEYLNPEPLEAVKSYLFVATLPYSLYSYVEACRDMKQDSWLRCHIHMYEFFGGVPVKTVCENLKTGVIRHPEEGKIILNGTMQGSGTGPARLVQTAMNASTGFFAGLKIKEQGYNSSLSLLSLSKKYSESRLESACKLVLMQIRSPKYHQLMLVTGDFNQWMTCENRQNVTRENDQESHFTV